VRRWHTSGFWGPKGAAVLDLTDAGLEVARREAEHQRGDDGHYPYVWRWGKDARPALGDRKGERCRVLIRSRKMNSVLIEFASDDFRVNTSRNAIKLAEK
jgi:hypothetical protein